MEHANHFRIGPARSREAAGAIVALFVLLSISACNRAPQGPPAPPPPAVIVDKPVLQHIQDYEEFPGHTESVNKIMVQAMVTGYLDKILFTEGDDVTAGAPLFEIDRRLYQDQFDLAQANLLQSQARVARLKADYRRAQSLLPTHAISQEDFDKVADDRAEADAAVKVAEASVSTAQHNLDYTTVRAKFAGRVSHQMIDPGNMVKANETSLTSLVSLDKIYIWFDVDERTTIGVRRLIDQGKVRSARKSSVTIHFGLADEEGFPHDAVIDFIDNQVDTATGTLRLRGVLNNPKQFLLPGMFLRVRVPIGEAYDTLLVPEKALGSDQGQKFVYLVDDQKKVVYQRVVCGPLRDGMRAIHDGIKPGDRVVVSGLQRIKSGDLVEPKEEASPPPKVAVPEPHSEPKVTPVANRS